MVKALCLASCLFLSSLGSAFESLPDRYLVEVGNPKAKQTITEYFSLSCSACVKSIKKSFPKIFEDHIQKGELFWRFHPDPQDLTTLRFLVCLETVEKRKRFAFFWDVLHAVSPGKTQKNCLLIQEIIKLYGDPMPQLGDLDFLEKAKAAKACLLYLEQKGIPHTIPAIEKNGKLIKGFPSLKKIKETLYAI